MDDRERKIAERFGILERMEKLDAELRQLDHILDVEYDLNGFLSDIFQVIIIPRHDGFRELDWQVYFKTKQECIASIFRVAKENGLYDSGDSVEDMGEHFYIVTGCTQSWRKGRQSHE